MKCKPEQHRALHALFDDLARAYPGTGAAFWKNELLAEFPRYLAQAEGREIPPRIQRESTLTMDSYRMGLCLEFVAWFACGAGVTIGK